jgi:hypothetical protein
MNEPAFKSFDVFAWREPIVFETHVRLLLLCLTSLEKSSTYEVPYSSEGTFDALATDAWRARFGLDDKVVRGMLAAQAKLFEPSRFVFVLRYAEPRLHTVGVTA